MFSPHKYVFRKAFLSSWAWQEFSGCVRVWCFCCYCKSDVVLCDWCGVAAVVRLMWCCCCCAIDVVLLLLCVWCCCCFCVFSVFAAVVRLMWCWVVLLLLLCCLAYEELCVVSARESVAMGECVLPTLQCDQIASLFTQYLAIYNDENLPYSIKIAKVCPKFGQIPNKYSRNSQLFCLSGEISPNLVTLLPS